jgi:putative DNA primase/helicase
MGRRGQWRPTTPAAPSIPSPLTITACGIGVLTRTASQAPRVGLQPFDVEALTRDQDGGGWGYLLTFTDPLGKVKTWAMPARMLSGDGGEYRAALLGMGLRIAPSPRARNLLTQFIQTRQPAEFASCTDRIGWHSHAFVLPRETIGDGAERIVFQSENQIENTFTMKAHA